MSETKEKAVEVVSQQAPAVVKKQITATVLARVVALQENKELILPKDYSPENALNSAFLVLSEMKDKSGVSVLEACSSTSIANSLLKMVVEGLSPIKKQCYFIPYGKDLQCSRSYQGSIALAKRVGGVKDVIAGVIYEADEFEYTIDFETGRKVVTKHEQKIENIDNDKIKGAYAFVLYLDGTKDIEIMTIKEIRTSWNQGMMKGNSGAHNNFTQEMCKKTVINRACKNPINSSSDTTLYSDEEEKAHLELNTSRTAERPADLKSETISFENAEFVEVQEEQKSKTKAVPIEQVVVDEEISERP